MVVIMPYRNNKPYDAGLDIIMEAARNICGGQKDDDFLIIATGATGCGKSSLMLHAYESYDEAGASINYVALNRQDHAVSLKLAKDKEGLRFCADDEANINRRDAMTKYNKDRIALYMAIRGLRIFHFWNNPSLEMIDKPFIEERLNGVFFIPNKHLSPRVYYYFRKEDILRLLEKKKDLKHRTLKKNAKEYAYYRGWFKKYEGVLWDAYQEKKQLRMTASVDSFYNEYGKGTFFSGQQAADALRINYLTFRKMASQAIKDGLLDKNAKTASGQWRVSQEDLDIIRGMRE